MYRRLPGNVLIVLICLTLAIFYVFTSYVFPSSIPTYMKSSLKTGITTPINNLQDDNRLCTTTTQTLSLTTTAPCTCPTAPIPPPQPQNQNAEPKHQAPVEEYTTEQKIIARLRAAGIVIIFKTGSQEVSHLAIQLGTTLRYLSPTDILFFSDLQGSLGPFILNDALRNVDQGLKQDDAEFEIYREMRRYQSTGRDVEELREERRMGDGRSGWRLDKWKFLHMVEETFEERPDAKWYVFIETDSYVFWDNLASFLARFDSTKPIYLGSSVTVGGVAFAHGGSGYVLSNAAMNKLLGPEQPQGLAASWDERMKGYCCGDLALGTALKEKEVHITVAHPLLNGYKPTTFTYGPNNHWCQPVVTMHHVLPHEISAVWRYERRRELLTENPNATIFAELYAHFVEPHLTDSRDDWDNLSHGPTFKEPTEKEKEEAQKMLEAEKAAKQAEERKKVAEEKAKFEKEHPTPEDKRKEEKKDQEKLSGDSKDTKLVEMEKAKEGGKDAPDSKPANEEEKKEEKPDNHSDPKAKGDNKNSASSPTSDKKEKKLQKRDEALNGLEKVAWESFENCQKVCEERTDCFQYVYYDKTCKLGLSFRLGKHVAPSEDGTVVWKSGWMVSRIREWTEVNACKGPEWPDIRPS